MTTLRAWRKVGWNAKLGRPLFTLRWGLGVEGVAAGAGQNQAGGGDPLANNGGDLAGDPGLDPLTGEPADQPQGAGGGQENPVVNQIHVVTNGIGTSLLSNLQARAGRVGVGAGKDLVVPLGLSPQRGDLLAQAQREGLDVVVLIKLSTKLIGLARRPEMTMVLTLYDAHNGKQLWRSDSLSSTKYLAQKAQGVDLADELLRSLGAYASQHLTLSTSSKVSAADAKKRIDSLIDDRSVSPLRKLAEVKFFQRNGSLTGAEALEYFRQVVGNDQRGAMLASGSPAERTEVINQWLPRLE